LSTLAGGDKYTISYDPEYDVMEIRVSGTGRAVIASEIRPNIFVHKDESGVVAGFTILHYTETMGERPVVVHTPTLPDRVRELVPA